MKRFIIILFAFCSLLPVKAQMPVLQWAKGLGNAPFIDRGKTVTVDNLGNVITAGDFCETVDFDPGPGVYNLTSNGHFDIFIQKLDANGNFLWARHFGALSADLAQSISTDNNGNIYLSGAIDGTVDFDPGSGVFNLSSQSFVLKLDANGNFLWAKGLNSIETLALKTAPGGGVCVTGGFYSIADFDPGPGTYLLTEYGYTGVITAIEDVYVLKLDDDGNFLWAKQMGGIQDDYAHAINFDPAGNILLSGNFWGTADFDPGPAVYNITSNGTLMDVFALKLNPSGNFIWVAPVGGQLEDFSFGIGADNSGNVFVSGDFYSTADFDPGPGVYNLTPFSGRGDMFVLKLSTVGSFVWAKQLGGINEESCRALAVDNNGYIYTTGFFRGNVDFDPGPGVYNRVSNGIEDMFVSKLDNNGNFVWAISTGSNNYDIAYDIKVDAARKVYVTGFYQDIVDFDPGTGVYNLPPGEGTDAFTEKLSQCANITFATLNAFACNSYTLNSQTYTASGTYTQNITNVGGCDSIITLNLVIGGSVNTTTATACDQYTWEGQNLTASGQYMVTYTGADGCDSIRKLNLVIRNSISTTINISICQGQSYAGYNTSGTYTDILTAVNGCDSTRTLHLLVKPNITTNISTIICEGQSYNGYTVSGTYTSTFPAANGCDSTRILNLQVNPRKYTSITANICNGETFYAGGAVQTVSGIYRDTLQTYLGCDSVITTTLTVHPKPQPNLGTDKGLCTGTSATLNPGVFSSYLWQNGSTQPVFSTNTTGTYWVTVKDPNNCTATDSVNITAIYPLPANFLKQADSMCSYEKLLIQSLYGYNSYLWSNGSVQSNILVQTPGVYWLRVTDQNGCTGTDTIQVLNKKCFNGVHIPSAFTPNGDGKNDEFKAAVFANLSSFRLQVYNRYGELVFETTDPARGWNGVYKGVPCTNNTYVWRCSYTMEGGTPAYLKGTLVLMR